MALQIRSHINQPYKKAEKRRENQIELKIAILVDDTGMQTDRIELERAGVLAGSESDNIGESWDGLRIEGVTGDLMAAGPLEGGRERRDLMTRKTVERNNGMIEGEKGRTQ